MPDPLSWLLIVICLLFSFFFSCSETAFACCNRFKMQVLADEGKSSAKTVLKICNKFDRALTIVLIGNNCVAVAISAMSTLLFMQYFKAIGLEQYASLVSSIIMSFVVYILGDTLPKTIAKAIPDTMSLFFAYPVYGLMIILFPIAIVFEYIGKGIEKLFNFKKNKTVSEDQLEKAIEKASDDKSIEEEQAEIVQSTLDFIDTNVKEVLTPKKMMFAIDINGLTHEKLQQIYLNTNYSRIPIYDGDFNHFIGVLHIKIYFEEYEKDHNISIRKVLQKPYFITPNIMIDDLFKGFKKRKTHLAIVRDKDHQVIGMVTMEDILEELVEGISEPSLTKKGVN